MYPPVLHSENKRIFLIIMDDSRILVSMRIRPPMGSEVYSPLCLRKAQNGHAIVLRPEETSTNMGEVLSFDYDYVFDEVDTQEGIYEECVQEMVDSAIGGSNSTVFAYGQTGSGKTFTILGDSLSQDYLDLTSGAGPAITGAAGAVHAGLPPLEEAAPFSPPMVSSRSGMFNRIFADLFRYRRSVRQQLHVCITLSILELYVDDVLDLLANRNKLKLREVGDETFALGITTPEVKSMKEVMSYFRIANEFRSVSATKMNEASSRSHALFFIDLYQFPVQQYPVCPPLSSILDPNNMPLPKAAPGMIRSRISLVDLAGSERVKRSGAEGQRMKEAQAINKSLSSLGNVINAMYTKNPHIPFRESKLTRLLKPSFIQSQSRVLLMGQASPTSSSASESLGTLRFCDRVKGLRPPEGITFPDPEQEKAFLASKRVNHELCADMRVASLLYYHHPVRLHALAEEKGEPMESVRMQVEPFLRDGVQSRAELAETAFLAEHQQMLHQQNLKEVENFIIKMNENIEEYEQIAQGVKSLKKAWKKTKEEQEKAVEEATHEAKKAKKNRLKLEQEIREKKQEQEKQLPRSAVNDFDVEDEEREAANRAGQEVAPPNEGTSVALFTEAYAERVTSAVEDFFLQASECGRLRSTLVARLRTTGNLRAEVRRMKLSSSAIMSESTVVEDLISFMIDRAINLSRGKVPEKLEWTFEKDVDGFSTKLKGARDLYPPLLPRVRGGVYKRPVPLNAQAHRRTFLSSDDSDDELSHYPNETRRRREYGGGQGPITVEEDMVIEDLDDHDTSGGNGGGGGSGKQSEKTAGQHDMPGGLSHKRHAAEGRGGMEGMDWASKMYEAQIAEEEAAIEAEGSSVMSSTEDSLAELSDGGEKEGDVGDGGGGSAGSRESLNAKVKMAQWDVVGTSESGGVGETSQAVNAKDGVINLSIGSPSQADWIPENGEKKRVRRRRHGVKADQGEEVLEESTLVSSPLPSGVMEESGTPVVEGSGITGGERRRHRRHRHHSEPKEGGEGEGGNGTAQGDRVEAAADNSEGGDGKTATSKAQLLLGNGKSVAGIIELMRQRRQQGTDGENRIAETTGDAPAQPAHGNEMRDHPSSSSFMVGSTVQSEGSAPSNTARGKAVADAAKPKDAQSSSNPDRMARMHLMRVYDSPTLVSDLTKFLRGGTVMVKHGRLGKPHKRLFWVSSSRGKPELLWMDPDAKDQGRTVLRLEDVAYLKMGCFSKVFKRHPIKPSNPQFFLCFTIGLKSKDRTVDVVADSLADFEAWVVGLSWMIGVDPCWGGKPDISKEEGFSQLSFFECTLCETHYIMPMEYLTLRAAVEERRAIVKEWMEKYPDDLKRLEAELDMIHPPEINEHGALLLTKGELRFLCPEIKLDIFRISHIWVQFESMNLVFDPSFSLATSFGITKRE